jgi:hypothetical protein
MCVHSRRGIQLCAGWLVRLYMMMMMCTAISVSPPCVHAEWRTSGGADDFFGGRLRAAWLAQAAGSFLS